MKRFLFCLLSVFAFLNGGFSMAGIQTPSILVVGDTGSGKSTFVKQKLLPVILPRVEYAVFVNTSPEFSEFAVRSEYVGEALANKEYKPADLANMVKSLKRVHFEISDFTGPFFKNLLEAVMLLGVYDTHKAIVALVIDEGQESANKQTLEGKTRIWKEGRKFGVLPIVITQQYAGAGQDIIHPTISRMARQVYVFNVSDMTQRKRLMMLAPNMPDPNNLKTIVSVKEPEYIAIKRGFPTQYRMTWNGSRLTPVPFASGGGRIE
jgi:energy-coupling factor transporter ATP-binding protein EcfA2